MEILARHKNRVRIEISGYKAIGLPKQEAIDQIEKYGIPYNYREKQVWWDISDLSFHEYNDEQLKQMYKTCRLAGKMFIYNYGYLSIVCCISNRMFLMNKYDECEGEYIKVSDVPAEDLLKKIESLTKLEFSNMCRYCTGVFSDAQKVVPAAEQLITGIAL